ncbi:hypothetical protein Msil_2770 [Methylocella silvestris BL2]|uniref:Uncharacterized protein n=1 Tax=Methylocella silvestris (strain DSM 15510 / CIP 108128 / LMG 27833 / NCIMB 13906 / BL2) TaxID=395965 RepID=B8ERZ2_METSB|nr:hypothetical protein [Methylocella silvestris]ACK51690.1 hypothetical protein Msil_2770 [Methylocella silvestris BL2]
MIQRPIHSGNGCRLRFFRSPRLRPELPWHAVSDLLEVLAYPIEVQLDLLRGLRTGWGRRVATIAVSGGPIVIAPNPFAIELIAPAIEGQLVTPEIQDEYRHAATEALLELIPNIAGDAPYRFLDACHHNSWLGQ